MGADPIRVLVVDDHEIVRAGVAALLGREPDISVLGAFASAEAAVEGLARFRPDVVVLDYRLQETTGADASRAILARAPAVGIVILTSFVSDEVVHDALEAGARGFLIKGLESDALARTVRAVARGEAVLDPEVTMRVIAWARQAKSKHLGENVLSGREREILAFAAQGLSNRGIAEHVCASETTVKWYMRSIMRKLGASRRYEAVAAGINRGVI